jgi:hypothetical protein
VGMKKLNQVKGQEKEERVIKSTVKVRRIL